MNRNLWFLISNGMNLNKVQLIGNLTRDPELKSIPSGQSVTTVGIATNRKWTSPTGEKKEEAEFHNVVLWGKLAEIASKFLKKGSLVYIEGRLKTRNWEVKDGSGKRYVTEIIAENLQMGPRAGGSGVGGSWDKDKGGGDSAPASQGIDSSQKEEIPQINLDEEYSGVNPENIPF